VRGGGFQRPQQDDTWLHAVDDEDAWDNETLRETKVKTWEVSLLDIVQVEIMYLVRFL
jgi:hypothetical protein